MIVIDDNKHLNAVIKAAEAVRAAKSNCAPVAEALTIALDTGANFYPAFSYGDAIFIVQVHYVLNLNTECDLIKQLIMEEKYD